MRNKRTIWIACGIVAVFLILLYCGYRLTPKNMVFFLGKRIPRVLAMIVVCIAIVSATLVFQTLSQNHILTPDLLGYSQLYTLIQTALVFFIGSTSFLVYQKTVNFLFVAAIMLAISFVLYSNILRKLNNNLFILLLVGSVLSTLFRSLSTYFQLIIDPNEFTILQNKLIASFTTMNTTILVIACILLGIALIWVVLNFHVLDVIQLGNDQAINLGIDVPRFQKQALLVIGMLISVSTALVGPLTFLGLIAVNASRYLFKTFRHREIWIGAVLLGIILVVGGQFLVERVFLFSVTLSVLMNLAGGIYVIYLILKERVI